MDFGHFMVVSGVNQQEKIFEDATINDINDTNDSSCIPIKVRLEDVRLICAKSSIEFYLINMRNLFSYLDEHWEKLLNERDSPMYLIRPMTFTLNVLKSICLDDTHLPMYKNILLFLQPELIVLNILVGKSMHKFHQWTVDCQTHVWLKFLN